MEADSSSSNYALQTNSRVLVVDDVPTNRSVLKSLLVKPDCMVFEAENGVRALDIVENNDLDLVVLDIVMPGMNGIEVLTRIRKRYSNTELPVLMLTVKDEIADIVKALETGANDYVTRPIDYAILLARINTLLSYKKSQDSIRESQDALRSRIEERTNELRQVNQALKEEVSVRLNAEEEVRRSQDRYRLLYNDTPSMFFTLDAAGRIASVNHFGAQHLGYEVDDLVGRNISSLHEPDDHIFVSRKLDDSIAAVQQVR